MNLSRNRLLYFFMKINMTGKFHLSTNRNAGSSAFSNLRFAKKVVKVVWYL